MKPLLASLVIALLSTSVHAEMEDMVQAGYATAIATLICPTRLSLAEREEFNEELSAFETKKENANKVIELGIGMDQAQADWDKSRKMHVPKAHFCTAAIKAIRSLK